MSRYTQRLDGEGWEVKSGEAFKLACCDCGLVHQVAIVSEDGKIGIAAKRDNRATGQRRKRNHVMKGPAADSVMPVYGVMDPDYARFLSMARCIAKAEGYALTVHGSFSRDLDVVVIPWIEKPNSTPSQLAHQIAGRTGLTLHPEMQIREHGRMTWTMHFKAFGDPRYIDFSATPILSIEAPASNQP